MASVRISASSAPSALDAVANDLQTLRIERGAVSYSELALRIAAGREAQGVAPSAARIARSTVFDAFRMGRRRINAGLVAEIAIALDATPEEAQHWRQRCLDALRADSRTARTEQATGSTSVPAMTPAPASVPGHATPSDDVVPDVTVLRTALLVAVLVGCVGLNLFGGTVMGRHSLPLFLDMVGTTTAAFACGPWWGALVGATTNVLGAASDTPETVLFALVNIAGAVVWGHGIRRLPRTIPCFLLITVVTAIVCSMIGTPLNVLLYGGASAGHAGEAVLAAWNLDAEHLWTAAFAVNSTVSIADKIISGLVGLAIARLLAPLRLGSEVPASVRAAFRPRRSG
ncbi:hypothetical protein Q9R19_04065 [Microbacterium sp. ARD32]|uniref:hypothetical protein n=1 Tax=Microbacterium sp. ARD32 TaxID=2962577 RepID=UPI0028812E69|nr:hypothetical protein [Microbacterium sp. ARD32]MDT0156798.1 hypothetical protein [Microbacterium sp. ARD32]